MRAHQALMRTLLPAPFGWHSCMITADPCMVPAVGPPTCGACSSGRPLRCRPGDHLPSRKAAHYVIILTNRERPTKIKVLKPFFTKPYFLPPRLAVGGTKVQLGPPLAIWQQHSPHSTVDKFIVNHTMCGSTVLTPLRHVAACGARTQ